MNGNNIVVKKNELVSKASYRMDHHEQLLFISVLSEINSKDHISDKNMYKINLAKVANEADISSKSFYSSAKKAIQKLKRREVSIPQENGKIIVTNFIQSYEYHDGEGEISIQFSNQILPYISHIRDSFVSYKLKQVAKFKSSYSVRIYEILIQRLDISHIRKIELNEVRELFKLSQSYNTYGNIKKKIINPAVIDINTYSDINVTYKEVKEGKKVIALEFHIEALEPRQTTKKQIEQEALPGETYSEVKERLKAKEEKKESFWKKIFK